MKKLLLPCLLLIAATSCKKNEDGFPEGWSDRATGPVLGAIYNHLAPGVQEFTLGAATNIVTTSNGIRFTIPENTFRKSGAVVPNEGVKLTIMECFNNKDLVTTGMTTTGTSNMLITGGAYYFAAWMGNDFLSFETMPIAVSVPEMNHNFNTAFKVHQGFQPLAATAAARGTTLGGYINWLPPANPSIPWQKGMNGSAATYDFKMTQSGYWGLFRPTVPAQPSTNITIQLPAGYGNLNTCVYLLTPEHGMRRFNYDLANTSFRIDAPVGLPVKVFTAANNGKNFAYDLRTYTTGAGDSMKVEPVTVTPEALSSVVEYDLD